eukprot:TRINITY_DN871_c2_g2_i2.p1 TRINITY_DN871_c2_g2~~TRINITY_DN871_c2_g2_i2.p1  ORF type:complete len:305 (+),score=36.64 TRINITY_DN871_c2_g2_i2:824-1738(+)
MPNRRPPLPSSEDLKRWGEERLIDFDEKEKVTSSWISTFTLAVYVFGQAIGVWVIVTRHNTLSTTFKKGDYRLSLLFALMTVVTDAVYYSLVTGDPGRLLREDQMDDEAHHEVASLMRRSAEQLPEYLRKEQYCKYCRTTKLLRAKHCHSCGCCVARFDHHCFWIYNCVGAKNHFRFFVLLILLTVNLGWGNYLVWESFTKTPPNATFNQSNIDAAKNIVPLIATFLGMPMWIFILIVLSCHIVIVATSVTTWEFVKRSKIPYLRSIPSGSNPWDKGCLNNVASFCLTRKMDWKLPPEYCHNPV